MRFDSCSSQARLPFISMVDASRKVCGLHASLQFSNASLASRAFYILSTSRARTHVSDDREPFSTPQGQQQAAEQSSSRTPTSGAQRTHRHESAQHRLLSDITSRSVHWPLVLILAPAQGCIHRLAAFGGSLFVCGGALKKWWLLGPGITVFAICSVCVRIRSFCSNG